MSTPTVTEFAVDMTCDGCVAAVRKQLSTLSDVSNVNISLEKQRVILESSLPTPVLQAALEATGKTVIVRGKSAVGAKGPSHLGAAICILTGPSGPHDRVAGVVRFVQVDSDTLVIDGEVTGLSAGEHGFHVHEFGDLSNGCVSTGGHLNPTDSNHGGPDDTERHAGDLGNIVASANGVATFSMQDRVLKVWDMIGRALVVHADPDDLGRGGHELSLKTGNAGARVACGIIARSSGVFENTKRVCACDGTTLWDNASEEFTAASSHKRAKPSL